MSTRITRADLERRLGVDAGFNAPFLGQVTARQALGVIAVMGVTLAYLVRGRIARKQRP